MSASSQVVTSLHYHAFPLRTATRAGRSVEKRVAAFSIGTPRRIHAPSGGATSLGSPRGLNAASLLDFEGRGSAFGDGEGIGRLAVSAGDDKLVGTRGEVVPDRHWRTRVHGAVQAVGAQEIDRSGAVHDPPRDLSGRTHLDAAAGRQ